MPFKLRTSGQLIADHRRFGWKCHSLPIENKVDRTYKRNSPKQDEELGIADYNDLCRRIVMRNFCSTQLFNFEAGQYYKGIRDPSVVELLAWTLPSNLTLCVHPDMENVKIMEPLRLYSIYPPSAFIIDSIRVRKRLQAFIRRSLLTSSIARAIASIRGGFGVKEMLINFLFNHAPLYT
ncbi:hypothetical protein ACTXT7_010408, partial [Hymenolepis weldensis]